MGWKFTHRPGFGFSVAEKSDSYVAEPSIALNVLDSLYYHYGDQIQEYRVASPEDFFGTEIVAAVLKGDGPQLTLGIEFVVDQDEMAEDPEVVRSMAKNLIERLSSREQTLLMQTGAAIRKRAEIGDSTD